MVNTNSIEIIVKVLENPTQIVFNKTIPATKFRVQFPQFNNTQIINLTFWGNLATDVAKYYQISDYILIEGSLSIKNKDHLNRVNRNIKTIEITVLKIYPFLLSQTS